MTWKKGPAPKSWRGLETSKKLAYCTFFFNQVYYLCCGGQGLLIFSTPIKMTVASWIFDNEWLPQNFTSSPPTILSALFSWKNGSAYILVRCSEHSSMLWPGTVVLRPWHRSWSVLLPNQYPHCWAQLHRIIRENFSSAGTGLTTAVQRCY